MPLTRFSNFFSLAMSFGWSNCWTAVASAIADGGKTCVSEEHDLSLLDVLDLFDILSEPPTSPSCSEGSPPSGLRSGAESKSHPHHIV